MYFFIKNLFEGVVIRLKNNWKRAKLQAQNRFCKFHRSIEVNNCIFEGSNTLFERVMIIDSHLGKHSYVQKDSSIVNAEIGRFCSIGPNVIIGPGVHETKFVSSHPSFYSPVQNLRKSFSETEKIVASKRIIIGNDVWIGANSILLDGIKIGHGAVIAAGAVVSKDVSPYTIVGGVPARTIKTRFDQQTIEELLLTKWWEMEDDWLSEHIQEMEKPERLIEIILNQ